MRKELVAPIILASCLLALLIYYIFLDRPDKVNISCHGTLVTQNELMSSRVRVSIFLTGERGRVNFDGVISNEKNVKITIRRASSFTLHHYGNTYAIDKSIASELPGNMASTDLLTGMFPEFMLFNDKDYRLNMYKVGNNGYLFMSDKFVTLYCVS